MPDPSSGDKWPRWAHRALFVSPVSVPSLGLALAPASYRSALVVPTLGLVAMVLIAILLALLAVLDRGLVPYYKRGSWGFKRWK